VIFNFGAGGDTMMMSSVKDYTVWLVRYFKPLKRRDNAFETISS